MNICNPKRQLFQNLTFGTAAYYLGKSDWLFVMISHGKFPKGGKNEEMFT